MFPDLTKLLETLTIQRLTFIILPCGRVSSCLHLPCSEASLQHTRLHQPFREQRAVKSPLGDCVSQNCIEPSACKLNVPAEVYT